MQWYWLQVPTDSLLSNLVSRGDIDAGFALSLVQYHTPLQGRIFSSIATVETARNTDEISMYQKEREA